MDATTRVIETFRTSAQTVMHSAEEMAPGIVQVAQTLGAALLAGNKILACGNGGSASDAQHFAGEMLNRFEMDRPGLPALALTADSATLTAIANDDAFDAVFAKQVRALGQPGDVLLAITTSGNSANIVQAAAAARERNVNVIALTGRDGGELSRNLVDGDLELRVPSGNTARIQEVHILIIHCLCDLVDRQLLGVED